MCQAIHALWTMAGNRGVCKFYLEGHCKFGDSCKFRHPAHQSFPASGSGGGGGSGEVCKFFLEGRCRFGDNCRMVHPGSRGGGRQGQSSYHGNQSSHGGQRGRYQQPPPIDTGRGWNQRGGRNRFDLYSSSHDDTDNWRGGDHDSGRRTGYHDRGQHHQKEQWDESQRGGDRYHYSTPNYRQSQDWKSSRGRGGAGRGQDYRPRYDQENPRRDAFKWERKELFKREEETPPRPVHNDPIELAVLIGKDMEESKAMWPFSCYGYSKEVTCVPGLIEMSAEEVRLLAYTAKAAGTSSAFLQNVEELERRQTDMRHQYINITPEEVKNMLTMLMAQPSVISSSGDWGAGLFGPLSTTSQDGAAASIFSSNFATNPLSMSSSASRPQPAALSSLSQGSNITKPLFSPATQPAQQAPTPNAKSQDYELSQEDLGAFKADKFVLGKIPEHTPPPDLC